MYAIYYFLIISNRFTLMLAYIFWYFSLGYDGDYDEKSNRYWRIIIKKSLLNTSQFQICVIIHLHNELRWGKIEGYVK